MPLVADDEAASVVEGRAAPRPILLEILAANVGHVPQAERSEVAWGEAEVSLPEAGDACLAMVGMVRWDVPRPHIVRR